jgi:serine protease DegS
MTRIHRFLSFVLPWVAVGLAVAVGVLLLRDHPAPGGPGATTTQRPTGIPASGPASYAEAVLHAAPSVVNIYSTKIDSELATPRFQSPTLDYFFSDQLAKRRKRVELGSGVIVSSDGYLLTNYHIIGGAEEIKVLLADGREVEVSMVGGDPDTDVAVLKANAEGLPVMALADLANLRVGDVVLAIGNPFGVGQTVTLGIVSATGRSRLGINTYENFIQTDAAINPGNSGGALINARGELIGINTAIFSQTGSSHGIGFAIPVDLAVGVMDQLIRNGRVVRAWLGITGQDVTPALAESFGLRDAEGVLVSGVLEDGPADKAGFRPGDVITHVDGLAPRDIGHLSTIIAGKTPGQPMRVQGWRGNMELDILVAPAERQPGKRG